MADGGVELGARVDTICILLFPHKSQALFGWTTTSQPWLKISQLVVLLVHTYLYPELIVGLYGLVG